MYKTRARADHCAAAASTIAEILSSLISSAVEVAQAGMQSAKERREAEASVFLAEFEETQRLSRSEELAAIVNSSDSKAAPVTEVDAGVSYLSRRLKRRGT
jgi:hypothetical protein